MKQEFNIDELINEKIYEVYKLEETHKIIKKGHARKKISADKARIAQVLINLLTNAIRYSPNANKIIVSVKEKKDSVIITIEDFGVGIAKRHQKKIFNRFYQVNNLQRKGSLGIGLYITNQIIKLHNGTITVDSTPGKGSTFTISLPQT